MSAHGMTAYFNPLPPHGGRLPGISRCLLVPRHFNPLPPHGGRRYACAGVSAGLYISIHSLRMEGDVSFASQISTWKYFNPLPPHGGRRGNLFLLSGIRRISIHSLRMEGDLGNTPKPPANNTFQSTPSAWRETCAPAPVAGAAKYFNPLPPHGGRHITLTLRQPIPIISIHSLRMEGDLKKKCLPRSVLDFNPLPPHGGRHFEDNESAEAFLFQSTPSAWRETFDT